MIIFHFVFFSTLVCDFFRCCSEMIIDYLIDDLLAQLSEPQNILNCTHDRLLSRLPPKEKHQLAKTFLDWQWNVGGARVLRRFQSFHILTATEYILIVNNKNSAEAQLILNDLLEVEFDLLADLLRHVDGTSSSSMLVIELITNSIQELIVDFCNNPNAITTNYLDEMNGLVSKQVLESVKAMHVKIFLQSGPKCSVEDAVKQFKSWNEEARQCKMSTLHRLIASMVNVRHKHGEILNKILHEAVGDGFECWKFYFLFVQRVTDEELDEEFSVAAETKMIAKRFFKDLFCEFVATKNERKFHLMILTARQICLSNEGVLGTYAMWYKSTIGEMKYSLKTDEFVYTLEVLSRMLQIDDDIDALQAHLNTYIPAPPLYNEHVLNYKQLCQSKINQFERKNRSKAENSEDDEQMEVIELE